METVTGRTFDAADETREADKAKVEVVDLGTAKAARMTLQPGWRWSESIKPLVGGDSCQARHIGVLISGSLRVAHDDGTEHDFVPGEAYRIEPGHDAWVLGDEPLVGYEFESATAETYLKTPT